MVLCHERRSRWPPHHHGAVPGAVPRPHGTTPPTRGAVVEARPRRRPSSEPAEVAATPVARAVARSRSGQGKAGSGLGAAGSAAPGRHRHGGGARRTSAPPRRGRTRPGRPYRRHPRGLRGAPGEPLRQRQGGGKGRGALVRRAVVPPPESPGAGAARGLRGSFPTIPNFSYTLSMLPLFCFDVATEHLIRKLVSAVSPLAVMISVNKTSINCVIHQNLWHTYK
jgi:hypothetical protein